VQPTASARRVAEIHTFLSKSCHATIARRPPSRKAPALLGGTMGGPENAPPEAFDGRLTQAIRQAA
jgi:hypothetical protein